MKILFDYQAFEMQKCGGVSRSFAELYCGLIRNGQNAKIALKESDNVYLTEKQLVTNLKPLNYAHNVFFGQEQLFKGHWRIMEYLSSCFFHSRDLRDINQRYSISLLKRQNFDVFHPTFFGTYFIPYLKKKPFVLTIHDMIPELYPQYFKRDDFQIVTKRILAPMASAVIAVSEKTKEDIVRILHLPEEKVRVIYHGCSFNIPDFSSCLFDFPYLLYVGDRFGYKRFIKFVEYAIPTLMQHGDLKIVCTGRPFSDIELSYFNNMGIVDKMVHYWVSNDAEFYSLYHYADCFVYPSEYEGFGIPILEAFAADCPVILNNASCFPEIAGDAVSYFSFDNPSSLAEALEGILSMSQVEREKRICKQRERLMHFSWQKSVVQLQSLYESVMLR